MFDWLIYSNVLHPIGRSNINERFYEMTANEMLLDVNVSAKNREKKIRYNEYLILFRLLN